MAAAIEFLFMIGEMVFGFDIQKQFNASTADSTVLGKIKNDLHYAFAVSSN